MSRLVVVGDRPYAALAADALEQAGHDILRAEDGGQALDEVHRGQVDLVLLGPLLPSSAARDLLRALRVTRGTSVVVLSSDHSESAVVLALELGADDYLTTPFSTRELVTRVAGILGRRQGRRADRAGEVLDLGPIRMEVDRHVVTIAGRPVQLTPREFTVLEILLRNADRVMRRDDLLTAGWGPAYCGHPKTLDVHINRLRRHLEAEPTSPRHLVTVRGVGYMARH